ncbi:MAG: tetratricopeptide repeat protein [Limisphaerales bacterium]
MDRQEPSPEVPAASRRDRSWRVPAICLVLAAITFAVFGQTLTHEFINYDDFDYVYENPIVARGLTFKGIVWAFTRVHSNNWHPLTWLSHMLDCQVYGLHPGGHHLTNVLLHTATVIALFLVLRQMTGALWRSAFVAAVFAIHPLRVESVAWVAERKDVLSGLFFMLTVGAYVRYARRPWSFARYGLVVLLFAMGLMCKPMVITLPVVLLLLDYWPLHRLESRKLSGLALEKLPLLALSAASCVITVLAQTGAFQSIEKVSLPLRFGNALVTCMVYLGQMVWPAGLALFYPYPHQGFPAGEVALAGTLLAGLSVVVWQERRRQPWLLTGWVWYLVMLLPVLGIIQVGAQAHADRYTYLPQIGIYMAVTWLAAEWGMKWRNGRAAFAVVMPAILAVLMVCAWKQTSHWQDNESLWIHSLTCTTDNYLAHYNLALSYNKQGRLDEAIEQYQKTLQIQPDHAECHYSLGVALAQKGRLEEAITHYQQALQITPGNAKAHLNLGVAFVQKGRVAGAIAQFQQALRIEPANPEVLNNLAWLLAAGPDASLRNGNEAVELARQANELTGGENPMVLSTLADALAEAGRFSEAVETAQRALRLAEAQSNPRLAGQLQMEMELYQAGRAYHMPAQTH